MVDPSTSTSSMNPPAANPPAAREKVRLRFRKGDDLRFLSHHDLLRCFERLLRRAEIPVASSKGFHPHPRLVFALSLPLGVVGLEEVADLELEPGTLQVLSVDAIRDRLRNHAPPGMEIHSAQLIHDKRSARVRSFCYRLRPIPSQRLDPLRSLIGDLLDSDTIVVGRQKHRRGPAPSKEIDANVRSAQINVRSFVRDLRVIDDALEMELWLTDHGTARPAELLELFGLSDLLEQGALLERTRLELWDETVEAQHL